MKCLGETKQILGIDVHIDKKNAKLWLSQQNFMVNILMRFSMNIVKPINIPLSFHCNISSILFPSSQEKNDYMSFVPYENTIRRLAFVMKCSILDISHVVSVVSGHMEKPDHWKWVLRYPIDISITYSGCNDLVCGYVDLDLQRIWTREDLP
jgi:hypothetical protein